MLVVLVTGARGPRKNDPEPYLTWTDREMVWRKLDRVNPGQLIVGDATGVDFYARTWARFRSFGPRLQVFDADWDQYGRSAGPIRNRVMAKALDGYRRMRCDVRVVAFHDDVLNSRGTKDMLDVARKYEFRRTLVCHPGTPSSRLKKGQI